MADKPKPKANFLDGDLSLVHAPRRIDLEVSSAHEPDLFLDCQRFYRYLQRTYSGFDIITYTVSATYLPVRRLISWARIPCKDCARQARYCANIHTKLFLCYDGKRLADAFVGSQNYVEATTLNVMTRVKQNLRYPLQQYFNSLWNQLK